MKTVGVALGRGFLIFAALSTFQAPAEQLQIIGWGDNGYNERDAPADLTNAVSVCAAGSHNIAVLSTGGLRGWGDNGYPVPALTDIQQVSCRYALALALNSNGTVTAWGANHYGGANVPAGLNNVVAVAAGDHHSLALKNDGTVVGWGGQDAAGIVPAGLITVARISAGISHSLALRGNGTVVAWGWNSHGQSVVPAGLNDAVAVSAGGYHSTALKADGTVVVWGGQDSSVQPPPGLSGVSKISAGTFHNLALLSNGTVVAWGSNSRGQASVPPDLRDVVAISAGHQHSLALTRSLVPLIRAHPLSQVVNGGGTLILSVDALGPPPLTYQWWKDGSPLPASNAATLAIENVGSTNAGNYWVTVSSFAGAVTSAVAALTVAQLTTGGALVNLGGPEIPAGITDVIEVDACSSHALAIKADGTVVGWGMMPGGGSPPAAIVPAGLGQVIDIAVELNYSLALKADGTVIGWGSASPATVPATVSNVLQIAASERHGMALLNDGRVLQWRGGVATDVGVTYATAIDGGFDWGVALNSDGTVSAWGGPYGGGYYFPGLVGITAVSLGWHYLLALRNDGTVAGGPEGLSNVVAIAAGRASLGYAVRQNGSLVGWGGAPETAGLTNVTRINANGASGSAGYGLAITRWPAITRHPQSNTVQLGDTVTLSVEVKGAGPFYYQWSKDGSPVSGANQKTLVLNNVQAGAAGNYSVIVGNASGEIESLSGRLSLFGVPEITGQPLSQVVFTGAKVAFSVSAIGANPLSYQWYHDGAAISGVTSSELVLASTSASDAGSYSVLVSNYVSQVTSDSATLVLTPTHTFPTAVPGTLVGLRGPALPPGLTNVIAAAAGYAHGLAVRADGTVAAWGRINYEQATVPDGLSNVVSVAGGNWQSLALRADGTVVGWGPHSSAQVPENLFGVVAIAGGIDHSLALKSDGTIRAWRPNGLSDPPAKATNVVSIDAGFESFIALRQNGTVVTWGALSNPGGVFENNLTNIAGVSLAHRNTMLLNQDGTVAGSPGLSNIAAVAAGNNFGLALKNDGTVVGIGIEVPAELSGVISIAAGGFGLAITTNPPQPQLGMTLAGGGEVGVLSTVSVPGYVLESATAAGSFAEVPGYTNAFYATNSAGFEFKVTPDANMRIFRLRKE